MPSEPAPSSKAISETTPAPSTAPAAPAGEPSSQDTSWRSAMLGVQAQSELRAAVATCLADAAAKGYSQEELAASYLGGAEQFGLLAAGAPLTFHNALEMARACGYRLRIQVEVLDDEVQSSPDNITTPFEVTSQWMANHARLKDMEPDAREEVLRQILALYFGQMREKGLYIAKR